MDKVKITQEQANVIMKVRLVKHDGSNWYGDAEIGNEYKVIQVNKRTYTIETDDPFSTGLDKSHCEIISSLSPVRILTEEELKEIEDLYNRLFPRLNTEFPNVVKLIASHRELLAANATLSFENMMRKRYEGFLKVVVRSGEVLEDHQDFEWFKERSAIYPKEELK